MNNQNLESAATEFQRRFHISADDNEPSRRTSVTSNVSQVRTAVLFYTLKLLNLL